MPPSSQPERRPWKVEYPARGQGHVWMPGEARYENSIQIKMQFTQMDFSSPSTPLRFAVKHWHGHWEMGGVKGGRQKNQW